MQELPSDQVREQPGTGPGSPIRPVEVFVREEKDYFSSAPVAKAEERLSLLQTAISGLAVLVRDRRRKLETERCAVCGSPWKIRLAGPSGAGMVPFGIADEIDPRNRDFMRYYACSESCLGRLRHEIDQHTFKALKDYDEEQSVRHLRPISPPPKESERKARR